MYPVLIQCLLYSQQQFLGVKDDGVIGVIVDGIFSNSRLHALERFKEFVVMLRKILASRDDLIDILKVY
jgi:hypothetical protein